uniref:Uncharacterized protein n=1 Tax=Amphimedon queenslandica TaxID=400682 RepID=A0A1X7UZQ1_AMPQE
MWDEYVDIDEEDIITKEKLKVFVTPILNTPNTTFSPVVASTHTPCIETSSCNESTPSNTQLPSPKCIFDSELDSDVKDPIIGQQLQLSSTNHGNETESVDVPLSVSSESSDIGPSKKEVEKGLKAKEMSNRVRSHFLSVAAAVLS